MIIRSIALTAIAAASFAAQAAPLTTYAPWEAAYTANGLSGVLFNINTNATNGAVLAMGAHAYKNGVTLANNGIDTFYANSGIFAPDVPITKMYANWSFDFGFSLGNCTGCKVFLGIDKDASSGVDLVFADITAHTPNPESWNMEMGFITAGVYNFNPYASTSTAFSLQLRDAAGAVLTQSDITVEVPEPGSLALVGVALAGLAMLRRRQA